MDQDVTWYGARPRPRRLSVRWGRRTPSPKGGRAPKFSAHVYCGQTAGWMKLVLGTDIGLSPGYFVLDGDPAPLTKGGGLSPPKFSAHVYCGQTAGWIKMPLGMEAGLGLRDIMFDVNPLPSYPHKKGTPIPTQFLAHVCCGQMAGWMKTPLGTEGDLGSGHIVLDGVPAPAKAAQHFPLFGPCLLWPRSPISATAELLF